MNSSNLQVCALSNPVSRYGYGGGGIDRRGNPVPCDYLYDVYEIVGVEEGIDDQGRQFVSTVAGRLIASGVAMLGSGRRVSGETMNPGKVGRCCNIAGKIVLVAADEIPVSTTCASCPDHPNDRSYSPSSSHGPLSSSSD